MAAAHYIHLMLLYSADRRNNMKRIIKYTCLSTIIFSLFIVVFATNCFAEEKEISSVYASQEECKSVADILKNDKGDISRYLDYNGFKIVEASITPVYSIDPLNYSRTNNIELIRLYENDTEYGSLFVVKLIDKEGNHAGNLSFSIKDETAYFLGASIISGEGYSLASCSYADHAERIRKCLKETQIIPPSDVRYVIIERIGEFFYIKNESHDIFVAVGYASDRSTNGSAIVDYTLNKTELKIISDDRLKQYEKTIEEKENWEKEHPGEEWHVYGNDGGTAISSVCSEVDNILDIDAFFKNTSIKEIDNIADQAVIKGINDLQQYKAETETETKNTNNIWTILIVSTFAAVLIALIIIVLNKKKNAALS